MKLPLCRSSRPSTPQRGFSLVEVAVAIALVGIGVSATIGALTKFNQFSTVSRNSTGAYALAMNQIDVIQSLPFNPAAGVIPPLLDVTTSPTVELDLPIYNDPAQPSALVLGKRTTVVKKVTINTVDNYRATVTVQYPKPTYQYSLDMSTVRVSD
jgi:prepilin-type N-terminal cleavage/methylation domain-containing protein